MSDSSSKASAPPASSVVGAEHFFGVLQSLYCAAAPVRDRQGRVVGVLDVSVQGAPFAFDALALVRLCVAAAWMSKVCWV